MNRFSVSRMTTVAYLCAAIALLPGYAVGQQKTLAEQLVGTWTVASNDTVRSDGSSVPTFGLHPKGVAIFDATGRCVVQFVNSDIPKFALNNRLQGTPEENQAAVGGGRYLFSEPTL
jgi:Lipocalin-like domain